MYQFLSLCLCWILFLLWIKYYIYVLPTSCLLLCPLTIVRNQNIDIRYIKYKLGQSCAKIWSGFASNILLWRGGGWPLVAWPNAWATLSLYLRCLPPLHCSGVPLRHTYSTVAYTCNGSSYAKVLNIYTRVWSTSITIPICMVPSFSYR